MNTKLQPCMKSQNNSHNVCPRLGFAAQWFKNILTQHKNQCNLQLIAASIYLPKHNEKKPRGEDAHFICPERNTIGVADGVGSWTKKGVDAGAYARELMENSMISIHGHGNKKDIYLDPLSILKKAHSMSKAKGSSTACIITLSGNSLHAANVGDSGFLVIRDGRVIFKSKIQQHSFNCPYQLGVNNCRDNPSVAKKYHVLVQEGDIVIAGTDGLFDNMYFSEILEILRGDIKKGDGVEEKACKIANVALRNSFDRYAKTPFTAAARKAGRMRSGGKIDDITVIVAYIKDKTKD